MENHGNTYNVLFSWQKYMVEPWLERWEMIHQHFPVSNMDASLEHGRTHSQLFMCKNMGTSIDKQEIYWEHHMFFYGRLMEHLNMGNLGDLMKNLVKLGNSPTEIGTSASWFDFIQANMKVGTSKKSEDFSTHPEKLGFFMSPPRLCSKTPMPLNCSPCLSWLRFGFPVRG